MVGIVASGSDKDTSFYSLSPKQQKTDNSQQLTTIRNSHKSID